MLPIINPAQRKKVLFLITQSGLGGAQRFLVNLTSELDKSKYDIVIAAGPNGNWEFFKEFEKSKITTHKLRHARRNISFIEDWQAIFEIRKLIKNFGPDVLFLNSSKTTLWGPMAVNFPKRLNPAPKIIYRIGGWSFNDPRSTFGKWLWKTLEKYSAGYKDIIIVNNSYDLEQAKKLNIKPRDKIMLIHNGIDLRKLEFLPKDEAKEKLGIKKDGIVIGTIANFYPAKGLKYLLEAIKILTIDYGQSTISCVIIGEGNERRAIESKVKEYGIENNVVLTGQIPDAKKYLKAFDIFVLPSVKEGFPWAVLEAMAAKLPIVATRVGAIPEIIEDSKNGFIVEPNNPGQLAKAIKKLLANEHLRQEFGIEAHQTVLFKFDEDRMIKQIEKLLI